MSLSKLIDLLNECLSREYDAIISMGSTPRSPTERSTDTLLERSRRTRKRSSNMRLALRTRSVF
jgi:hypothetical protein